MLRENIRIAKDALVANRLRSALSVLGICIGVMSVTLLLAVGAGASAYVKSQVAGLGTDTLYVYLRQDANTSAQGRARRPALTQADLRLVADQSRVPSTRRVAPELLPNVAVSSGRVSFTPRKVVGSTPQWAQILGRATVQGTMFTDDDVTARRRVVVIGRTVARRISPGASAVGSTLRINGTSFEIIGLLDVRGGGLDGDSDNVVLAPWTAIQDAAVGAFTSWDEFIVQAVPGAGSTANVELTKALLEERHLSDVAKAEFEIFDNAQLAKTTGSISVVFSALLGLIAGISLLVGGIGVMNIMLVTVTERTREIGIRKALGAKRKHLLTQFLVESVVLTGVGGLAGLAVGGALSRIRVGTFTPLLQPWMVALAFGVSVFIGVTFGVYPANRAAKLRPIDALRFE